MFDLETYNKPREYTPTNVIYWEASSRELRLAGRYGVAILTKARNFLQNNSIKQLSNTAWMCNAIKDYNKTDHEITLTENGLICGCQGFKKKQKDYDEGNSTIKPICSHTLAVKQFCFIEEENK